MVVENALAYYDMTTINVVKGFTVRALWANPIKLFMKVIYKYLLQARAFVPGMPFQPSLMFAGKAGAYLSETHFSCSTLG
jgi:hypothetical protein